MAIPTSLRIAVVASTFLLADASRCSAQIFEAVGSRALGMGGAFVAVASDSSGTWWNPAGLADGPFMDMAFARNITEREEPRPAARDRASWFAVATPVIGFSYYRLRITDIRASGPTAAAAADREDTTAGGPVRSSSVVQTGATVLQTLLPGVHVGSTLKYVRGTVRTAVGDNSRPVGGLLDDGEALDGGDGEGRLDVDVGVLAVAGPIRLGGVVRNIREPTFGDGQLRLPRQVRLGAAFDVEKVGGTPLMIAVDADAKSYETAGGFRAAVAVGVEQWLFAKRLGLRAGGRLNRVGAKEKTVTGGISVSLRSGLYVDGHIVRGGSPRERGWGAAARVSF
jgi:hypothetical protein